MPLPIVPIVIAAVALAVLGKKKPKPNGQVNGGNGAATRQPQTLTVTMEELATMGEVPMVIGDTLNVSAADVPPSTWALWTEVIEGSAMVVVNESVEPPAEPMPGAAGIKRYQIVAVQEQGVVVPSVGVIKADFSLCPPGQDPATCEPRALVNLVITAA